MSLEPLPSGGWRCRWRDPSGRHRSASFPRGDGERSAKQVARDFQDRVNYERKWGHLERLDPIRKTVAEVAAEWSRNASDLAPATVALYDWLYASQIAPRFASTPIGNIRARDIEAWLSELDVGTETKLKASALLNQIFNAAIRWEYARENPVALARKPKRPPKNAVRPPTPLEVEAIRAVLNARGGDALARARSIRSGIQENRGVRPPETSDACLVSVLAYAGLRPQEALRLRWQDVRTKTLLVDAPKTGKSRSVRLCEPLAHDLAQWAEVCPDAGGLVFPNSRGKALSKSDWNNWRRRVWGPAVKASGGPDLLRGGRSELCEHRPAPPGEPSIRPYDLRHTFCSLLIREGMSVTEVAGQAGHSPKVCLDTYAHSWEEWKGSGSAEDAIYEAREKTREAVRAA